MAVSTAPKRMPTMGLVTEIISRANQGSCSRKAMLSPMMSMPVIRAIKPKQMVPMLFFFSLAVNIYRMMPTAPMTGDSVDGLKIRIRKLSPSRPLKDRIQAVTVVPMLEPMMTPTAWFNVIMPELTKPTTMTVVAELDWITAVTARPSRKPLNTLELILARMVCSLPPAVRSRDLPMISMPNRNSARPPSRVIMLKMYVVILVFSFWKGFDDMYYNRFQKQKPRFAR